MCAHPEGAVRAISKLTLFINLIKAPIHAIKTDGILPAYIAFYLCIMDQNTCLLTYKFFSMS